MRHRVSAASARTWRSGGVVAGAGGVSEEEGVGVDTDTRTAAMCRRGGAVGVPLVKALMDAIVALVSGIRQRLPHLVSCLAADLFDHAMQLVCTYLGTLGKLKEAFWSGVRFTMIHACSAA